jgi:putative heme-binding domain-containing protein
MIRAHRPSLAHAAVVIAAVAALLAILPAAPADAVEGTWVWFGDSDNAPRRLRRTFDLPSVPQSATLSVTADNVYTVYLNGERLGGDAAWESVDTYDVAKKLRAGRNVLALEAANQGGMAGVFARLDAVLPGGKKFAVGTDAQTKVSLLAAEGWLDAGFDDAAWATAVVLGDASIGPWNIGGGAGNATGGLAQTQTLERSITAPVPAEQQRPHFVVPEGFSVELVAAEPLVINPVTIAMDERGRLYVSESHTYRYGPNGTPVKPYTNPIIRLEPQADGSFRRELIAEGFEDPVMGMAIRDGKLWAAANNLLYQFTLPPSGPATDRRLLVEDKNKAWNPFGMFVLEWQPDGLLCMSVGDHEINLVGPGNTLKSRGRSGMVMRMKPDGTEMELLTQGFRVPYSFDIDPFGQLWLLSNGEGNPNRFARIIEGVDYHCFTRNVDGHWLAGRHRLSPPALELPGGAHTQLIRYYDAAYPQRYQGSLFLDNWGRHGFTGANRAVFRYVTDDRNNVVETEPFVSCGDPHFRVSHILLDPQGNMLLADWYGRDDESDLTGRIWRIRYTGGDRPAVSQSPDAPEWSQESYAVAALGSPSGTIRSLAVDRLAARGAAAIPALRGMAEQGEPLASATALWTLARIGTPEAKAALAAGAAHGDWKVRRLSLQLMRRHTTPDLAAVAGRLAQDADPAVRLEAIRGLTDPAAARSALAAVADTSAVDDDHLRYELAWLMARNVDRPTLHRLLGSQSEPVRRLGELVIDISAYEKFPGYELALEELGDRLASAPADQIDSLLSLARMHGTTTMVPVLAQLATRTDLPAAVSGRAILAIRGFAAVPPEVLAGVGQRFLEAVKSGAVAMQSPADWLLLFDLLEETGPTDLAIRQVSSQLAARDGSIRARAHALARGFGAKGAALAEHAARVALQKNTPPEICSDAVITLAAVETPARPERWAALLDSDDPFLRREAVRWWRLFKNTPAQAAATTLLLERAPRLAEQDATLRADLAAVLRDLDTPPERLASLAAPAAVTDKAVLAETVLAAVAASQGDAEKRSAVAGRGVFARVGCVKCHTEVLANTLRAPSLKGIGQAQKPPYLVESILAPSAILKTGFETERIETVDGRVLTGLVKEEGDSLRVITADDEKTIRKSDVEERAVLKLSLMPEGQERLMSPTELTDLVEYLISLR